MPSTVFLTRHFVLPSMHYTSRPSRSNIFYISIRTVTRFNLVYVALSELLFLGERGVIRRGRTMRHKLFHTNWKHVGLFDCCCCHFVFLFRSYIPYRERLDFSSFVSRAFEGILAFSYNFSHKFISR